MSTHRVVGKLQTLVRFPTVSYPDWDQVDVAAFDGFLAELAVQFPLLHERLELTRIDTHGLLFHWPGRSAERPVVLMAHLDVVPVDGDAVWKHPPFGGEIHDGAIWGRGTLDDKGELVAICEAVETLLEQGATPAQDVWLSFGCNEEISGTAAGLAVEELTRRGVRPWMVLDEGGAIASNAFPGVDVPVGVVGVTEKGVTSIELRVDGAGGHASTPARNAPTVRIARAVSRLDRHQMAATVPEPTLELFRRLAPHAPRTMRSLMQNAGRIRPLLTRALIALGPETAATARTTFAMTTLSGSPALNVIASTAKAGVNIRINVGDSVTSVLEHVRKTIDDDQVQVTLLEGNDPSPVSPMDEAFELIEATIVDVFPDAMPAPYVMMAATDSRHFTKICPRVYRFAPFRMSKEQRGSIHTNDEHLGVDALVDGVRWYQLLIERLPG